MMAPLLRCTWNPRGETLSLNAPEALAAGLATELFTTIAGLAIFLSGQIALFFFRWLAEKEAHRA